MLGVSYLEASQIMPGTDLPATKSSSRHIFPSQLRELFKRLYLTVNIEFDEKQMDPRNLYVFVFVIWYNKWAHINVFLMYLENILLSPCKFKLSVVQISIYLYLVFTNEPGSLWNLAISNIWNISPQPFEVHVHKEIFAYPSLWPGFWF